LSTFVDKRGMSANVGMLELPTFVDISLSAY